MDSVILSFRWQNILAIWIMVILLGFIFVFAAQFFMKATGMGNQSPNGSVYNTLSNGVNL